MSNFIPMVSSSPPPLEDTGGFDDWDDDDDDFGTFTGVNNETDFTSFSPPGNSDAWQNQNSESSKQEFGNFASFENLSDHNKNLDKNSINLQNNDDIKEKSLNLNFETSSNYVISNNEVLDSEYTDSENTEKITRNTTRDSGLCSTDISPGQRSDDNTRRDSGLCSTDISPGQRSDDNTMRDSGLCSTDISPGQRSDDNITRDSGLCSTDISPGQRSDNNTRRDSGLCSTDIPPGQRSDDNTRRDSGLCSTDISPGQRSDDNTMRDSGLCSTDISQGQRSDDNITRDSGLCSTDISPGQRSDDNTTRDSGLCSTDISPGERLEDMTVSSDKNTDSDREELYDSQSEDSTSKDISETTDMNQIDKIDSSENSDICVSETAYNGTSPQESMNSEKVESEDSNEIDYSDSPSLSLSANSGQSDSEIIHTDSTLNNYEKNNRDRHKNILLSSQNSKINSDSHSIEGVKSSLENNLVTQAQQKELESPPSNIGCDNSSGMKDSGIVMVDPSTLRDPGIDDSETVIDDNGGYGNELNQGRIVDSKHSLGKDQFESRDSMHCHDNIDLKEGSNTEKHNSNTTDFENNDTLHLVSENFEKLQDGQSEDGKDEFSEFKIPENESIEEQSEGGKVLNNGHSVSGRDSPLQEEILENSDNQNEDVMSSECDEESCDNQENSKECDISNEKQKSEVTDICDNSCLAENDDNDDDFADFQTVPDLQLPPLDNTEEDTIDKNGDKFGEFSDNAVNVNSDNSWGFQGNAGNDDDGDDDDWATFQEPVATCNDGDDDDDFGDFGEFSGNSDFVTAPKTQETTQISTPLKSEPVKVEPEVRTKIFSRQRKVSESIVDGVVEEMVTESDTDDSSELPSLDILESCLKSKKNLPVTVNSGVQKNGENPVLWPKLRNLNATTAIQYQWPESKLNKNLFKTLRIDTQNILLGHKKQSVPIYASNLTMLEPTKGPIAPKTKTEQQLVDTENKSDQLQTSNMDIPPVQFDWTTSGLTNPLEENRKTLGLDFLVVQETEATSRSSVLSGGDQVSHDVKTTLQPLESILATLKVSTVKKTKHTENLSDEAAKIITSLPDLSFMHAKVLMFPLRQENNS